MVVARAVAHASRLQVHSRACANRRYIPVFLIIKQYAHFILMVCCDDNIHVDYDLVSSICVQRTDISCQLHKKMYRYCEEQSILRYTTCIC